MSGNKGAEATRVFWAIEIAATTFGESGRDTVLMSMEFGDLTASDILAVM